jgi:hypothetical protein
LNSQLLIGNRQLLLSEVKTKSVHLFEGARMCIRSIIAVVPISCLSAFTPVILAGKGLMTNKRKHNSAEALDRLDAALSDLISAPTGS